MRRPTLCRVPRLSCSSDRVRAAHNVAAGSRGLQIEIVGGGAACVVSHPWGSSPPPKGALRALINPANRLLVGTALPYFPRGGPLPQAPPPGLTVSSGWGGMDAGSSMLYPAQVVDGLTHLHAGPQLRAALKTLSIDALGQRCGIGRAVVTSSFALKHFDLISHTPTPFWPSSSDARDLDLWKQQLSDCYVSSVSAIIHSAVAAPGRFNCFQAPVACQTICIASPLLGTGAAGAPVAAGAQCAALAVSRLLDAAACCSKRVVLRFVLNDAHALNAVVHALSGGHGMVVS
jgi:O-acetyl-ADP-ribose deacetylase (regulator of RNase III)